MLTELQHIGRDAWHWQQTLRVPFNHVRSLSNANTLSQTVQRRNSIMGAENAVSSNVEMHTVVDLQVEVHNGLVNCVRGW